MLSVAMWGNKMHGLELAQIIGEALALHAGGGFLAREHAQLLDVVRDGVRNLQASGGASLAGGRREWGKGER